MLCSFEEAAEVGRQPCVVAGDANVLVERVAGGLERAEHRLIEGRARDGSIVLDLDVDARRVAEARFPSAAGTVGERHKLVAADLREGRARREVREKVLERTRARTGRVDSLVVDGDEQPREVVSGKEDDWRQRSVIV